MLSTDSFEISGDGLCLSEGWLCQCLSKESQKMLPAHMQKNLLFAAEVLRTLCC